MKCVNLWKAEGINSFSMIHDSYGSHAAHTYALMQLLREAFVEMYREPLFELFKEEIQEQLPMAAELPDVPSYGALDIELIHESLYFFA